MISAGKQHIERIAELLKQRRIALGYKQTDAASRAGLAIATLRKFEQTGEISLERFVKLCRVYKMDMHLMAALEQRDWWALEEIQRAETKKSVRSTLLDSKKGAG
jgi:transcriptional regulator with XRE-family HTH domain